MSTPPKLLGKYATPRFDYGDVVACERRGDVRIVGLSEAPIRWPIGQRIPKGRGRSLVVWGSGAGGQARVGRGGDVLVRRRREHRLAHAQDAGRRTHDRRNQ